MNVTNDLSKKRCLPCEGGVAPMTLQEIKHMLEGLPGWQLKEHEHVQTIARHFHFSNYYEVMAFVNAVAFLAHQEDHHPDMQVSYNYCCVSYTTHAISGLSENDFICAAKVSQLLAK